MAAIDSSYNRVVSPDKVTVFSNPQGKSHQAAAQAERDKRAQEQVLLQQQQQQAALLAQQQQLQQQSATFAAQEAAKQAEIINAQQMAEAQAVAQASQVANQTARQGKIDARLLGGSTISTSGGKVWVNGQEINADTLTRRTGATLLRAAQKAEASAATNPAMAGPALGTADAFRGVVRTPPPPTPMITSAEFQQKNLAAQQAAIDSGQTAYGYLAPSDPNAMVADIFATPAPAPTYSPRRVSASYRSVMSPPVDNTRYTAL